MDDRFMTFLKQRVLRCVRIADDSSAGLAYCAVESGKTMLCFTSWPYETGHETCDYVNAVIKPDGDSWVCGRWRIEINSIVEDDQNYCPELAQLREYEAAENTNFEDGMAVASDALKRAIERMPYEFV